MRAVHGLPSLGRRTDSSWTPERMPDLHGTRAAVTGVTSGLGTQTASWLARAGAEVVLLARTPSKLEATAAELAGALPDAVLHPVVCDLADQASVRRAAPEVAALGALDLLVNNAGVMAVPFATTPDGFELQMGTNHFGHFTLTGLLLESLVASGDARVVTVTSNGHRLTPRAPLGDPRRHRGRYSRWDAYSKSKLANLLFTFELDRRAARAGLPLRALAAHPGYSATELTAGWLGGSAAGRLAHRAVSVFGQPSEIGCYPTLYAATEDLPGSTYVGPDGPGEWWGYPRLTRPRRLARDEETAARLWELSQDVTGVIYP